MSPEQWGQENPGVVEGGGFRVVCLKRAALGFEPRDLLLVDPAIEPEGGELVINREIDGGSQLLTVKSPVVLIVQKGIAKEPRIPAMRGIMMARKKPLNVVAAADAKAKTTLVDFTLPPPKAACKMVDEENAKELIAMLHEEAKVL